MLNEVLSCQDVCFQLFADKTDYYHRWYHAKPMLITSDRRDELRRMQAGAAPRLTPILLAFPYLTTERELP